MATYTETDDASRREGVAARGLGAGVWARALKPEQTLSLQGSRYGRPLGVSCGVPETRPVGETVRSASDRSKPPQPKEEQTREGLPMNRDTPMSYQDPKQAKSTMFKSNLKPIFSRSKTKHWYGVSFLRCHY